MEITIKPTTDQTHLKVQNHGVSIIHPSDDLNLDEVVDLINAAVRAYGFSYANLTHEPKTNNDHANH